MAAKATVGGVRLLGACAAFNLSLAALGWLWQGDFVEPALVARLTRMGGLAQGSWNWNSIHVLLWELWLSGVFAMAWGRIQAARLPVRLWCPRWTLVLALAWEAAAIVWLLALADISSRQFGTDVGAIVERGPLSVAAAWTAIPLLIGAVAAIVVFGLTLRRPRVAESASKEADASSPSRGTTPLETLQLGTIVVAMMFFGLFWQFVAFGPSETTWSLDRLYSGPAAEARAAWTFLLIAHTTQTVGAMLLAAGALRDLLRPVPATASRAATESDEANESGERGT